MMFIDDKGFRNDKKPLVDFVGKFLVSFGEKIREFLIGKLMLDDTDGKTFQIFLTFSLLLGTPVTGDHDFRYFRLLKIFMNTVFRFVEEVENGHLSVFGRVKPLFGLPPEPALVHDTDLLGEKINLFVILGQPGICGIELFEHGGKLILQA